MTDNQCDLIWLSKQKSDFWKIFFFLKRSFLTIKILQLTYIKHVLLIVLKYRSFTMTFASIIKMKISTKKQTMFIQDQ